MSTLALIGLMVLALVALPHSIKVKAKSGWIGPSLAMADDGDGGGLVRSLGGWSEVLALRRREQKMAHDQRILGDSDFVQDVTTGLDDLVKRNLRLSGQRIDIDGLAAKVCRQYKISVGELCSGSRRLNVVQARAALSWIAVRELGCSGAEVARYLSVTNSCVTRIVASDTKPPVEKLIKEL